MSDFYTDQHIEVLVRDNGRYELYDWRKRLRLTVTASGLEDGLQWIKMNPLLDPASLYKEQQRKWREAETSDLLRDLGI